MFDAILNTVNVFSVTQREPWINLGDVLLVGEGNLSFSKNLLVLSEVNITQMVSTTFEKQSELSAQAIQNANFLKHVGVNVIFNVDARCLEKSVKQHQFNTIIFQFPNVGSRDPKYGQNPNHIMVREFLRNARSFLEPQGKIIITIVDSAYYKGVFRLEDAAEFAGYKIEASYPFDPTRFSGYSHVNTNDDSSAVGQHQKTQTWVLKLK